MKSKQRKRLSLESNLNRLLTEQLTLFLFKRGLVDELRKEQLEIKYPNLKESLIQNRIAIISIIEELMELMGSTESLRVGQRGMFE
jgi:hypothetical protein